MHEIIVIECLDDHWSQWFEGMEIIPRFENGDRTGTILLGSLPDQAALFGILNRVRSLNLTLVEFHRSNPSDISKGGSAIQIAGHNISI